MDRVAAFFLSNPGLVVGAVGGIWALWQYRKNQKWRETEFIAKEAKDFFENPLVIKALKILDWEARKIEFGPCNLKTVNRDLLRKALRWENADEFTYDEVYIRDLFDTFFDRFGRFEQYVNSGVVSFKMVKSYFDYWGGLLTGKWPDLLDHETLECIWGFLCHYEYTDVQGFLVRFGTTCPTKRPMNVRRLLP
jgi:hypothetical protein